MQHAYQPPSGIWQVKRPQLFNRTMPGANSGPSAFVNGLIQMSQPHRFSNSILRLSIELLYKATSSSTIRLFIGKFFLRYFLRLLTNKSTVRNDTKTLKFLLLYLFVDAISCRRLSTSKSVYYLLLADEISIEIVNEISRFVYCCVIISARQIGGSCQVQHFYLANAK